MLVLFVPSVVRLTSPRRGRRAVLPPATPLLPRTTLPLTLLRMSSRTLLCRPSGSATAALLLLSLQPRLRLPTLAVVRRMHRLRYSWHTSCCATDPPMRATMSGWAASPGSSMPRRGPEALPLAPSTAFSCGRRSACRATIYSSVQRRRQALSRGMPTRPAVWSAGSGAGRGQLQVEQQPPHDVRALPAWLHHHLDRIVQEAATCGREDRAAPARASPLSASCCAFSCELSRVVWPIKFKTELPPRYHGIPDTTEFL